jgi:peptidoglycan/xylan/chitin deacetylase (PgdA/CDA1 family)
MPIYIVAVVLVSQCLNSYWDPGLEPIGYGCDQPAVRGVALSFDDSINLGDWNDTRDFFLEHNITATFFIDRWGQHSEEQINIIHELNEDGHEIGFHSKSHKKFSDYILGNETSETYYEDQILQGYALMNEAGYNGTSFAYPHGSRNAEIDALILQNLSVLRGTRGNVNGVQPWLTPCEDGSVFRALSLDVLNSHPDLIFDMLPVHDKNQQTLLLYGHGIGSHSDDLDLNELKRIAEVMDEHNIPWLSMSELGEA